MLIKTDGPPGLPRNPFLGCIVPRPIGWVSSLSADGVFNLAPYSFFNGVANAPPMVMFASNGRQPHGPKDSVTNIEATGEFVCNLVSEELGERMNATSASVSSDTDEFDLAGLETEPSELVKPPRVKASPLHLECTFHSTMELPCNDPESRNTICVGRVIGIHIRDQVLKDGIIDIEKHPAPRPPGLSRLHGHREGVSHDPAEIGMDFHPARRPRTVCMAIALACLALTPTVALVAAGKDYDGIALLSIPPIRGVTYDVDLVAPLPALEKIAEALDVIYRESPFSAGKIEALKRNGKIELIYDPNHPDPKTSMASVQIAKFVSQYKEMGRKEGKNYLAVVGRHGIKWPLRELAAVLVHELVGHGIQHMKDRFKSLRNVDLECEAWLYEEKAYQDFRFDKSSREMIRFRQELEGVGFTPGYCTDFKRHMRNNTPGLMRFWDSLNPDVPKLLVVFEGYLRDLREMGMTGAVPVAVD